MARTTSNFKMAKHLLIDWSRGLKMQPTVLRSSTAGKLPSTAVDADLRAAYIKNIAMKATVDKKQSAKPRRSAAASASLRAEILRVSQMSVEERIRTALGMKRHFSSLRPASLQG